MTLTLGDALRQAALALRALDEAQRDVAFYERSAREAADNLRRAHEMYRAAWAVIRAYRDDDAPLP